MPEEIDSFTNPGHAGDLGRAPIPLRGMQAVPGDGWGDAGDQVVTYCM